MAEDEPKEVQDEMAKDEVDESENGGENGGERSGRSKRSIINVPNREYVKDGVKYRKDTSGKWREVVEMDYEED